MKIISLGRKKQCYYLKKSVFQIRFEISLNLIQTESQYLRNTCPDRRKLRRFSVKKAMVSNEQNIFVDWKFECNKRFKLSHPGPR